MGKKQRLEKLQTEDVENVVDERNTKRLVPTTALNRLKLTDNQEKLMEVIDNNKIIIITGPAGTGKTAVMTYYGIKALQSKVFTKLVLTKPIEESGEKLGFLPGDVASKIDPFIESYKINFLKYITKQNYEKLIKEEYIEFKPLAYMRGTTFQNSVMLLDEAQNADIRQIMLFVTRMGVDSKVIIAGDIGQYDIHKDVIALDKFSNMIKDIDKVATFQFTEEDIMRDPILKEITKRYEEAKNNNTVPKNKR